MSVGDFATRFKELFWLARDASRKQNDSAKAKE